MANYPMNLKNLYWNIMISPKCSELVSMFERYSNLRDEYLTFNRKEYFVAGQKVYEKMNVIVWDISDFLEENINLEQYGLEHFDEGGLYSRLTLALTLLKMYKEDI